jgi:hypothetical protein
MMLQARLRKAAPGHVDRDGSAVGGDVAGDVEVAVLAGMFDEECPGVAVGGECRGADACCGAEEFAVVVPAVALRSRLERLSGLWCGCQCRTAEAVQVVADGDDCGGVGVALFGECLADGVAGDIEVSGGGTRGTRDVGTPSRLPGVTARA